ncbi:hypothetical protein LTR36_006007 [Oleoguttula mirabilis]|uniref:SprT-like domain-containing protein n=1 Tax=Oleoguttula mirabilis TaxID=1507867 RepID=A0AAV9JDS5_9PEZI|nr:hypothetical protein LTR36_006007 [Oleoguttula mirabilis]
MQPSCLPKCQPSLIDLQNEVHPLLAPDKFILLSTPDYELLKQKEELGAKGVADHAAVATLFGNLTQHVHCFRFWPDAADGLTYPAMIRGKRRCTIKLGKHLLDNIQKAHSAADGSEEALVSHLFYLAITILHELVHAANDMLRGLAHEPFFEDDPICELGEAYENLLLGGIPMLCRDQLTLHHWPWTQGWRDGNIHQVGSTAKLRRGCVLPGQDIRYGFAAADIQRVFTQAYWEGVVADKTDRVEITITGAVVLEEGGKWLPLPTWQIKQLVEKKQRGLLRLRSNRDGQT